MCVYTGGGYHLYWKLEKRANFPDDLATVEFLNKQFAEKLHGDHVHDVTRIMRVPGTTNYKYDEGITAQIVFPKLTTKGVTND